MAATRSTTTLRDTERGRRCNPRRHNDNAISDTRHDPATTVAAIERHTTQKLTDVGDLPPLGHGGSEDSPRYGQGDRLHCGGRPLSTPRSLWHESRAGLVDLRPQDGRPSL